MMKESIVNKTGEREELDIFSLLSDLFHHLRRLWWVVLLTTVICGALFYQRSSVSYAPSYTAEATVSVEVKNGEEYQNQITAEQMGTVFPYIFTSGALYDMIAADLDMSSVPGSIRVSSIEGTNLMTVSVTGNDAEQVYAVLQSVLKNYPEVAQYVIGQTELTVIDETGVPGDTGKEYVLRGSARRGLVIGFLLGMALLALYTLGSRTVRSEEDLRSLLNLPCLGTLPVCRQKRRRNGEDKGINILLDNNRGDYTEAMRLIRTRIERQMTDKQVLLVTSSIPGEGKSTVAANLAISLAKKGRRVVLVDCDLRNPSQGKIFRLEGSFPGIAAVLKGETTLDNALCEIKDGEQPLGLKLLPGSEKSSRMVEVLGTDAMGDVLEELKKTADFVILDTPPSAMLADAMILVRHVDGVAYVVMGDFARRRVIYRGVEELTSSGTPVLGCILNGGKVRSEKYGYYGYRSKYGYSGYGTRESGKGAKESV